MITEETKTKREAVNDALFDKLSGMISAYHNDMKISPIEELTEHSVTFCKEFQTELERHIPAWQNAKKALLEKLIVDAVNNKERYDA